MLVRRFAEAAALDFPDSFFDFIYVDAGHEYANVARDLDLWWPKLKAGGMLAGDDFADLHDTAYSFKVSPSFGVKSAVAEFSARVGSPFFLTFADRPHWTRPGQLSDSPEEFQDMQPAGRPAGGDKGMQLAKDHGIANPVRAHAWFPAWYLFK